MALLEQALGYYASRRLDEAEQVCLRLLEVDGQNVVGLHLLALIAHETNRSHEAVDHVARALEISPGAPELHNTLANALTALSRFDDAERSYRAAIALHPDFAEAHDNLGRMLLQVGRANEAIESCELAARLKPELFSAHFNLANAAHLLHRLDEAEAAYESVLKISPDHPNARMNLAAALLRTGRTEEAIDHYRASIDRNPDDVAAWKGLLAALLYAPNIGLERRFELHRGFGRRMEHPNVTGRRPLVDARDTQRPLRIGYISADFRDHPVGRNLRGLFAERDRSRFTAVCYSNVAREDDETEWFKTSADAWRSIVGSDDVRVAHMLQDDGVDIAVHVAGRFDQNRLELAAWRLAPVQVSLFDGATSGLANMDYFIADPIMAPRNSAERFTERVLRLPNFYTHAPKRL